MLHSEEGKVSQYLTKYQNPEKSKRDVMGTLQHYRGLSCKLEPYVFNDGTRIELVNLQGTIPVQYKGTFYNIPICIWLMDTHPNNAPMCYVKPTSDMHIKVSQFVDHTGKIYLPYLHTWTPGTSDLLTLIQVMIVTFGEQPPVYSKPRSGSTSSSTPYPNQPYMPVPSGASSSSSSTPYPPYPPNSSYPATSYPNYPPYPSQQYMPAYSGTSMNSMYPYGNYPPYPPSTQLSPPQTANGGTTGPTGTITEDHIKASLMSAVQDKMRRRLREQFSQMQAELETLGRTQQELNQGKNKLDEIIGRLEKEESQLDKNIKILEDKNQELEKAIARLADQEPIDVDEAVTTTAPLYKQLLNAFAEEAATEDTIYYMGEALRRGVIDLDVFLKQVRTLSRKQFMLRALMQKCRQKAGLAG